jgi:hypothetical protein
VQTARDQEIVGWIARIGAAGAEHVQARFGMGRSQAYARLSALSSDGLLEQKRLLHRTPGLYVANTEGLRWSGQERLGAQRLSAGGFQHAWEVASAAVALRADLPEWGQLSERELRAREVDEQQLIASVALGELPGGRPALHRPDLALLDGEGHVLAIEVELTVKAARRLQAIARAYARARHLSHVYYLAAPPAARAVSRAAAEVRASERITVLALDGADALAAAVRLARGRGHGAL